jgi:hypothetical protein
VGWAVTPSHRRSRRDLQQDEKSIQKPKRDRRHHEHVDRGDCVGVIVKKGPPALRWRPSSSHHVLRHSGLADIDAKLKEFAMDARSAP